MPAISTQDPRLLLPSHPSLPFVPVGCLRHLLAPPHLFCGLCQGPGTMSPGVVGLDWGAGGRTLGEPGILGQRWSPSAPLESKQLLPCGQWAQWAGFDSRVARSYSLMGNLLIMATQNSFSILSGPDVHLWASLRAGLEITGWGLGGSHFLFPLPHPPPPHICLLEPRDRWTWAHRRRCARRPRPST